MNNENLLKKFKYTMHLMRPHGGPGRRGPRGPLHPAADPTRGQGRILAALKLQDGIPTKDLAYILDMRVASLNEALVKLETAGLISRTQSPEDGRVVLISLTDDGRSIEQIRPERPDAFATLDEEQLEQLDGILDRMIEHLESVREDSDEDSAFESWSEQARERMGDERFEAWMEKISDYAPEGPGRHYRRHHGRGHGHGGRGRGHDSHGDDCGKRGGHGKGRGGRGRHDHGGNHGYRHAE